MLRSLYTILFFTGCGVANPFEPDLSSVMGSCETPDFSNFKNCIQRTYARDPGASTVRAFYAYLNRIEEGQIAGAFTHIEAKLLAYKAYENTVGEGNRQQNAAAGANFLRAMENIQTQDRLSRESFNANRVKTTNCNTMGSRINCTSY